MHMSIFSAYFHLTLFLIILKHSHIHIICIEIHVLIVILKRSVNCPEQIIILHTAHTTFKYFKFLKVLLTHSIQNILHLYCRKISEYVEM